MNDSLSQSAPNFVQSLANRTHRIQWTTAAELPMPLYSATAVVKDYKAYIAGSSGPDEEAKYKIFVYDISENSWSTLPDPNVLLAVHEIIGGRLTLVGGRKSSTNERSKQLFSFNETSRSWVNHFPDMLKPRNRCSVVTHSNSVIVAGGTTTGDVCLSSIEVMSITELRWREVATVLPFTMWNMSTTICNNDMYIIGYAGSDNMRYQIAYKLAVSDIENSSAAKVWKKLHSPPRARTTVLPYASPPLIVGGNDNNFNGVVDVSIYNVTTDTWSLVDMLKTARAYSIVAAVDDNAIIVIGGCHEARNLTTCKASAIKTVEIGQAVPKDF